MVVEPQGRGQLPTNMKFKLMATGLFIKMNLVSLNAIVEEWEKVK